jgi:folate-binding protein YgfZ
MQLDFSLGAEQLHAIQFGSVVIPDSPALFWIEGPGALDCLQGLLTNDLAALPENGLGYGAMLTGKGMIILDPFILRRATGFLLILPGFARPTAVAHLARTLPPRLARVEDRTESWQVLWLLGNGAPKLMSGVAGAVAGSSVMPFKAIVADERSRIEDARSSLEAKNARIGDSAHLAAARVLAGWPSLGREIDEKTLPQEVRFDELGAVSYSKGCYTGQETVARVHFRGHPNRQLRGLVFPPIELPGNRAITVEGKEVGVLRTTVRTDDRMIALATLRREVSDDATVQLGGASGRVTPFPVTQGIPA